MLRLRKEHTTVHNANEYEIGSCTEGGVTDELAGRTPEERVTTNEGAAAFWSATPGDDIRPGIQCRSLSLMLRWVYSVHCCFPSEVTT